MHMPRKDTLELAHKLLDGTQLTEAECEEVISAIDQSVAPEARAIQLPYSNLIPWPSADKLRSLAERSGSWHNKKA